MTRSTGLRAVLLLMLCLSGTARAQSTWSSFAHVEVHGTLLNGAPGAPLLNINSGWAVRGGVRRGGWGTFLQVEQSLWRGTEYGAHMVPGALNLGIGSELRFANGLVRSSLTCHERITLAAWSRALAERPSGLIPPPPGNTAELISAHVLREHQVSAHDERQRNLVLNLVLGVQAPDTHGHSMLELENTRAIHADPGDEREQRPRISRRRLDDFRQPHQELLHLGIEPERPRALERGASASSSSPVC